MTRDLAGLFAAVRATPAEDLPRELYAEALEQYDQEHPATVEVPGELVTTDLLCPQCRRRGHWRHGVHFDHEKRCGECNISWEPGEEIRLRPATVLDMRLADRVEFIRAGVELARCGPKHKQPSYPDQPTALTVHGDKHYSFTGYTDEGFEIGDRVDLLVHRSQRKARMVHGFRVYKITPERDPGELEVYVRLDAESGPWKGSELIARHDALLARHRLEWLGGEACGKCGGSGKSFKKGIVLNTVGRVDGYDVKRTERIKDGTCPACHGTGWACWPLVQRILPQLNDQPPYEIRSYFSRGWVSRIELTWEQLFAPGAAAAIWRHHPVTECVVIDAVVHHRNNNSYSVAHTLFPENYRWRLDRHRTPEAARKALSDVACEWGREQAGITTQTGD